MITAFHSIVQQHGKYIAGSGDISSQKLTMSIWKKQYATGKLNSDCLIKPLAQLSSSLSKEFRDIDKVL